MCISLETVKRLVKRRRLSSEIVDTYKLFPLKVASEHEFEVVNEVKYAHPIDLKPEFNEEGWYM